MEHKKMLALANLRAEANGALADRGVPPSRRGFLLEGLHELATVKSTIAGLERVDMDVILDELKATDRGQLAWAEVREEEPADAIGVDLNDVSYRGRMARMNAGRKSRK